MSPYLPNSYLIIISFHYQLWIIVVIYIFQELIDLLVVAIGFKQDTIPEQFITDVELNCELYYFTDIVTLVNEHLDGFFQFTNSDQEISMLFMHVMLDAKIYSFLCIVLVRMLQEIHEFCFIVFQILLYLHYVIFSAEISISMEYFI